VADTGLAFALAQGRKQDQLEQDQEMIADHLTGIEKFEADLWTLADDLRANSNLASNEYFMPILGLLFLRQASNRYYEAVKAIEADQAAGKMPKRPLTDADFAKRRALNLPAKARYQTLLELEKGADLGAALNAAMEAVEQHFPPLAGQLPKDYARFDNEVLERMLRMFDAEALRTASGDVFGRIYEYFLAEFPALKGKSVAQLAAEYKKVSGELAKLQPLGAQKTAHEAKLLTLKGDRANLLQELAKARNSRWTDLGKAVKSLNKRLEGQLRIDFESERVRAPLKDFLLQCKLDGVAEKRLAWIDDADTVSVAELVNLIRKGSDALLGTFKKAGMQKQVADALAGLPAAKVRELEELELPERMELLLNVSRESENYREVGKLSTGQQCTAILHLLLLDNPDPLIIDQPEDNLDNAFNAEHIVNELRTSKTKRQYIFATHNANIPVFGDAEWIGVLQEEDGRSKLLASGSIDAKQVKDLAANILEGGREAFTGRREKYGL
jgi:hypothetical protein